ncbi:MAG: TonB-dependent receptor [Gammaproteobacteria bacterium]|nr:TonB-dependent receptor [Gammaproteobacteria bacterium]MDH5593510.1 TonB-dependent receptor [Gammaproteobacteria bacterium]
MIIITPEWREIDIQKMPMTVNVLSGDVLDSSGIEDSMDLQYRVPGFVFKSNSVLGQPFLRGVGSDLISAGSDASVSTFVDGVYQARSADSIHHFYDIERVEVLKGPQSVHLGRNVIGGAVSIINTEPKFYHEAYADMELGSFDKQQFRGMVNIPIDDYHTSIRFAGLVSQRDGYTKNIFSGRELDNEDIYSFRGKLLYSPSSEISILFGAERTREDSTRSFGNQPDPGIGVNGGILAGGTVPADPRQVTHNTDDSVFMQSDRLSAKVDWALDGMDFISLTAYQKSRVVMTIDLDGTEINYSSNSPWESSEFITQEFRWASRNNRSLGWVAGLYYLHEEAKQRLDTRLPLVNVRNRPGGDVMTDSYAAFGQLSYEINPAWKATAGIRYSYDKRSLDFDQTLEDPLGVLGPAGTTVVTQADAKNWDAVTPEFGIEYSVDKNKVLYANISRGFKSGGFNTSAAQSSFSPEYLWAFEGGMKSTFPAHAVRINGALFLYDYKDMQLLTLPQGAPATAYPTVANAAKATVQGLDLEIQVGITERLDLSLAMTMLDAQFDSFISVDPNNKTDDPDRAGDPLPQAPKLSLNLGINYQYFLEAGTLNFIGNYRYQSSVYFNAFSDPAVRQGGYGLIDVGLIYESRKGRWYAEFYGKNLTDKLYAENIIRQDPLAGTQYFWGAPRTFGLRVGYRM